MRGNISKHLRKSFSFTLVGCGRIGHCYATVINSHPDMSLASVIDINPEAARAFGSSFNCDSYVSLDDYLATGKFSDAAIICTPPSEHSEIASRLMKNRIHVLCEPPFALNIASAEKMIDISRAYSVSLMLGSKFRYVSDTIQAKGLIEAGILGHVLEFEGDFRDMLDMSSRWNVQPEISGGGVLMDSGSSAIDAARFLFGSIQALRAEEGRRVQSKDVEDTVRLELSTSSGILGTLHLSWALKNNGEDYFRIYGTQGNMCIGWKKSMYRPSGAVDWIQFGEGYNTQKALRTQLCHFIKVVSGEEIPEISAEEELESVRVIEAAYKSLASGNHMNISASADSRLLEERKLSLISSPKASFPTWIFNR